MPGHSKPSLLHYCPVQVSTALTLRYTPTPKQRSTFDTYRFMLSDPEIPVKEKAAADQDRKVAALYL